ncbi:hypothetical protein [Streptomyces sp. NPDC048272]|uniref:hypothetical protein n=1 Tax=Streptomyces sp. NPDC048272 TaxID=3154616 RepID=UPI0034381237
MSQLLMSLHALSTDPGLVTLAGPVPDFDPTLPKEINGPTKNILAWTAGGGLALAVLGGLRGGPWSRSATTPNAPRWPRAASSPCCGA